MVDCVFVDVVPDLALCVLKTSKEHKCQEFFHYGESYTKEKGLNAHIGSVHSGNQMNLY